jgi:NAD(P)-dependent dehydrogenase (short-subunit alcohol dehydrogenase family)
MPDPTPAPAQFAGRVAIITGAGSGIGRAMALLFAQHGAQILVNDIVADRAHETVALITQAGGAAHPAVADIADEAAVAQFVSAAITQWGRIDILCNNAGIMDRMQLATDVTTAEWDRILAVNVSGQFFVTRAVLPHMVAARSGAIVFTASLAGTRGGAAGLAYTASKHAVVGLARSLAWTYRRDGIRTNAVCPGAVITNITGPNGLADMDKDGMERLSGVMALSSRPAMPEDIARAALFLASDAASYVNGAILPVDAGWAAA